MITLSPTSIIVRDRQRKSLSELDEGFVKSVNRRLIHPIVIRRENGEDNPVLVAGGMRLAALIKGGTTELIEGTHFRYMDDLDPLEAQKIELEENVKRTDLPWRDHVRAVGKIHALYSKETPNWTPNKTAGELNISERSVQQLLMVYRNLDSPSLKDAQGSDQAYSILQTISARRAASIVNEITNIGSEIFNGVPSRQLDDNSASGNGTGNSPVEVGEVPRGTETGPSETRDDVIPIRNKQETLILCADFLKWIKEYQGPKFTVIHADFPYDTDYTKYAHSITSTDEDYSFGGFKKLLEAFCVNLDKFASYSSHVMFWFSMTYYEETKKRLGAAGLYVHDHPLIWHKTDNSGIIPGVGNQFPRRIYETAFLCSRGKRPLVKPLANAYGAPLPTNSVHPSQKSESMLSHFLSMLIDETTDVFDPTAGSGAALRAADALGARSIFGLELSPTYAETANSMTVIARNLRKAAR